MRQHARTPTHTRMPTDDRRLLPGGWAAALLLVLMAAAVADAQFGGCNSSAVPMRFCSVLNGAGGLQCADDEKCKLCSALGTGGLYEGCVCTFACHEDADCAERYPDAGAPVTCVQHVCAVRAPTPLQSTGYCQAAAAAAAPNDQTVTFGIDIAPQPPEPPGDLLFGFAPCTNPLSEACVCASVCTPPQACVDGGVLQFGNGQQQYLFEGAVYDLATQEFQPPQADQALCGFGASAQQQAAVCLGECQALPPPTPVPQPGVRTCTPTCVRKVGTGLLALGPASVVGDAIGTACACTSEQECDDQNPATVDRCLRLVVAEPNCSGASPLFPDCLHGLCVHHCAFEVGVVPPPPDDGPSVGAVVLAIVLAVVFWFFVCMALCMCCRWCQRRADGRARTPPPMPYPHAGAPLRARPSGQYINVRPRGRIELADLFGWSSADE